MKCSRCQLEKPDAELMVHARRYRKRTDDYYIRWYCHPCQALRVNTWAKAKRVETPKRDIYTDILEDGWYKTARLSNDRLMAKYAT